MSYSNDNIDIILHRISNSGSNPESKLFVSISASSNSLSINFSSFTGDRGGNNLYLIGHRLFWISSTNQMLSLLLELPASRATFLFLWCLLHWVLVMGFFSHVILWDIRVFLRDLRVVSVRSANINIHKFPFPPTSFDFRAGRSHYLGDALVVGT